MIIAILFCFENPRSAMKYFNFTKNLETLWVPFNQIQHQQWSIPQHVIKQHVQQSSKPLAAQKKFFTVKSIDPRPLAPRKFRKYKTASGADKRRKASRAYYTLSQMRAPHASPPPPVICASSAPRGIHYTARASRKKNLHFKFSTLTNGNPLPPPSEQWTAGFRAPNTFHPRARSDTAVACSLGKEARGFRETICPRERERERSHARADRFPRAIFFFPSSSLQATFLAERKLRGTRACRYRYVEYERVHGNDKGERARKIVTTHLHVRAGVFFFSLSSFPLGGSVIFSNCRARIWCAQ